MKFLRFGIRLPTIIALYTVLLTLCTSLAQDDGAQGDDERLVIFTIATEETDGYKRFIRTLDTFNLKVEVLGMNEEWKGGDVMNYPGGGHKINLFIDGLKKYKDEEDTVILFSDSYDVIFTTGQEEILRKFKSFNASLVFSAENYLWPDKTVKHLYPAITQGYPYLCSGLYIGYAPYVWKAITHTDISDTSDDQLFFTKLFLDKKIREEWPIKLDHLATLFQNLNGAREDVKIRFEGRNSLLHNIKFNTVPVAVHGNGGSKTHLNGLGNYLVNMWSLDDGCMGCNENIYKISDLPDDQLPPVVMALFIEVPTPFLTEFLQKIRAINYPKNKIDLFIHNNKMFHFKQVQEFADNATDYHSVKLVIPADGFSEGEARNRGVEYCNELNCQYYFNVDSDVQIDDDLTLKLLIQQNRPVIAPLVYKKGKLWTNFWGELTNEGYYARSDDYIEIVKYKRFGVWNVPFVAKIYLIHGEKLRGANLPTFTIDGLDPDMAMCQSYRNTGTFMYVDNQHEFGHLITTEYYETSHLHNDLWEIFNNREDWEAKYIHPDYYQQLTPGFELKQPCPDVYEYPVVTRLYAKQLVEEMEHFGQWSNGGNDDARLDGGYENVPTRDIHMKQINYERHWLFFLKEFIGPVCERVYPGYYSKSYALMNFVVRYKPDEQPILRAHHDSSTYTINMALNDYNKDYKGGGARFIRYNCSCIGLPAGHTLMHPGRLTHYHEGLETTWGTRYIMVSFIDP